MEGRETGAKLAGVRGGTYAAFTAGAGFFTAGFFGAAFLGAAFLGAAVFFFAAAFFFFGAAFLAAARFTGLRAFFAAAFFFLRGAALASARLGFLALDFLAFEPVFDRFFFAICCHLLKCRTLVLRLVLKTAAVTSVANTQAALAAFKSFAYPGAMNSLQEVWIRPRKVFRALASQPIGILDYLLSGVQGVVVVLALGRASNLGSKAGVAEIFLRAATEGMLIGIAIVWVQAWIYTWMGRRAGGVATRAQVIHVLAYGSVPMLGSLAIWCLAALLLGNHAFIETPSGDADAFVSLLNAAQVTGFALLGIWSVILQVMGLSEVHQLRTGGAAGTWLLGQVVSGFVLGVILVLVILITGPLPQT